MPTIRCVTNVRTLCSTSSGTRRSVKHPANRSVSPIVWSVAPSNSAPASEVIVPPSNPATTCRPSTGANPNRSALHSVGIGEFLRFAVRLCRRRTFADSEPQCTYLFEKCGLALSPGRPPLVEKSGDAVSPFCRCAASGDTASDFLAIGLVHALAFAQEDQRLCLGLRFRCAFKQRPDYPLLRLVQFRLGDHFMHKADLLCPRGREQFGGDEVAP